MLSKLSKLSLFLLLSLFSSAATAQNPDKSKDKNKDKDKAPVVETLKTEKTTPTLKPAPVRKKGEPLDLPEVEGWVKSAIVKYPQREMGYSYNYDSEGRNRVSIYVYNNGRRDITNSLAGPVKEEIELAKSGIDALAEMGSYSDVKVEKDEKAKLAGKTGKIDVLRKVLSFRASGTPLHSEIIIFPFEGDFVKIRITRPKSLGVSGEEAVNKLLAEIDAFFVMFTDIAGASRTAIK